MLAKNKPIYRNKRFCLRSNIKYEHQTKMLNHSMKFKGTIILQPIGPNTYEPKNQEYNSIL